MPYKIGKGPSCPCEGPVFAYYCVSGLQYTTHHQWWMWCSPTIYSNLNASEWPPPHCAAVKSCHACVCMRNSPGCQEIPRDADAACRSLQAFGQALLKQLLQSAMMGGVFLIAMYFSGQKMPWQSDDRGV